MNRRNFLTAAGTALTGSSLAAIADADAEGDSTHNVREREFNYITFADCTHATVGGRFTDGDVVYASTGWYDDNGLYGNTLLEHGIEFGPDAANAIETPFEGEIHINIGHFYDLSVTENTISLVVPGAQDDAALTGLTTNRDDYMRAGITHENPHADGCLDNGGDTADPAEFEVSIIRTNTPVDAGDYLEVVASVENHGGKSDTQDVSLIVGHNPTEVESQTVSLDPDTGTVVRLGYTTPRVNNTQTFPVYVESADTGTSQQVRVNGSSG